MSKAAFVGNTTQVALSSTYAVIACNSGLAGATELSEMVQLLAVDLHLNTRSGDATVTWYLSQDAAGDEAITDEVTDTTIAGLATSADGSVSNLIDRPLAPQVAGTVYVVAKLDAGTANGFAKVYWSEV